MKNKKTISLSFLISFSLHLVLAALVWFQPTLFPSMQLSKDKHVEVELVDAEKLLEQMKKQRVEDSSTKGQIVEQDEKAINDEIDKDARFLSRHNQKVVNETQAALYGKFKNSDGTGGARSQDRKAGKTKDESSEQTKSDDQSVAKNEENGNEASEDRKEAKEEKELLTSNDGVATGLKGKPKLKDLMPSFKPAPPRVDSQETAEGGGEGPSATDDHLKNVATGMQTVLSTREFVYYSYYNRIKDKLRQYWEPKIKEKMERIIRQGRQIASSSDRITKIVIILDTKGTLVRVQVIGPSGVQDLDEAAVEAFRAAAPFPNPPKGIADPDGSIRIRWDFILEANLGNGLLDAVRLAKAPGQI